VLKKHRGQILLGLGLLALTGALYLAQIAIFRDPRSTFFYLLQDLAFVPVQVLLVTVILSRLLAVREKRAMLHKMNMVIGAFFSEAGTRLLTLLARFDTEPRAAAATLAPLRDWTDRDYAVARRRLGELALRMDSRRGSLAELRTFLLGQRVFLLRLLENPNLLEHESFTELLWAVFHLGDEMACRSTVEGLPDPDLDHLSTDIRRAYALLLVEWAAYLGHLRRDYPYLHSLAVRTNPYDASASAVIGGTA
jgi:hypothetical protein